MEKENIIKYLEKWADKLNKTGIYYDLIELANALEAYSMYFVQGIADEKIAFFPTSQSFIDAVEKALPIIFYAKIDDIKLYKNTLSLKEITKGYEAEERQV